MAASKKWTEDAADLFAKELGREVAEALVIKLARIPGANASVTSTLHSLKRAIRVWRSGD